jgi:hypothetical protein
LAHPETKFIPNFIKRNEAAPTTSIAHLTSAAEKAFLETVLAHPDIKFIPNFIKRDEAVTTSSVADYHNNSNSNIREEEEEYYEEDGYYQEEEYYEEEEYYQEEQEQEEEEEEEELAVRLNACGHIFGTKCITTWLARSNSCPMCRTALFPKQDQEEIERAMGVEPNAMGAVREDLRPFLWV